MNKFVYKDGQLFNPKNLERFIGSVDKTGYLVTSMNGKTKKVHNIIWEMFNGPIPTGHTIDHIDRNPLNNRIENLRLATPKQQSTNKGKSTKKILSSQYKGVTWNKKSNKWQAQLRTENRAIYLGVYDDEVFAAAAYDHLAEALYGTYAGLNFPNWDTWEVVG